MWTTNRRKGIMLCYPFEEKRLAKWEPPYIVQPKLDGERCRAVYDGERLTLYSSEENEIVSVPHIRDELFRFVENFHKDEPIELDGELYSHGLPFEEIHSRVGRTRNLHEEFDKIEYHVFDVVNDEPQVGRLIELTRLKFFFSQFPHLNVVRSVVAKDFTEIIDTYNAFIHEGYEGMVVRHAMAPYIRRRSTYVMKFKPKKTDFYKIIGIQEEVDKYGEPKGRLGAFVCTSDEGTTFSVGTGLTEDDRVKWWTDAVVGYWLKVEYQHTTPGRGVPRFPVFVQVCDEHLRSIEEIP